MEHGTQNSIVGIDTTAIAHFVFSDPDLREFFHPDWSRAEAVPLALYWSGETAPVQRQGEARILWSNDSLTVRFVCNQAEPPLVAPDPQTEKKTIGLWDRDACETFIAPNPNEPNRYFEFDAAPTGEWVDLAIHLTPQERKTDWQFCSGMTAAGRIDGNHTLTAMRIPWGDWAQRPQRGEKMRINLFRCVGSGKDRGYISWLPTLTEQPNFHVPEAFGLLLFS